MENWLLIKRPKTPQLNKFSKFPLKNKKHQEEKPPFSTRFFRINNIY